MMYLILLPHIPALFIMMLLCFHNFQIHCSQTGSEIQSKTTICVFVLFHHCDGSAVLSSFFALCHL